MPPALVAAAPATIYHMSYFQGIVIGLIQGVSELFPLSSLGHTVLIPSWIGGTWATLVRQESSSESPYLAFVVGLHLATALVLLGFYIREWLRLIGGFVRSVVRRRIETDDERLAWMVVIATIPVGIAGLALEHTFRVLFAKPLAAALFLAANGVILLLGELVVRRRQPVGGHYASRGGTEVDTEAALTEVGLGGSLVIGSSQILALLAGISREGVAMVGGLFRGLSRENAMRFAFLLATPVILAAGALKVPDLLGPLGDGVRGPVVAGSLAAAASAVFAVMFLARWFKTRTLKPFAVYSLAFGVASAIRFGLF